MKMFLKRAVRGVGSRGSNISGGWYGDLDFGIEIDSRNNLRHAAAMKAMVALFLMALALPAAASGQPAPKASSENAQFQQWLVHQLLATTDPQDHDLVYGYALVDLNGDGRKEAIVWTRDSSSCGSGGCDLYVYVRSRSGWDLFSTTSVTRPPIRLLTTRTHGWLDLGIWAAGGGIERPYEARLRFNGSEYEIEYPADWTGRDAPPQLVGRDLFKAATHPLFPNTCHRVTETPSVFGPLPFASKKRRSC